MTPIQARVIILNPEHASGDHDFANDVLLRGDCSVYYTAPDGHEELCPKCRGKGLRLRRGALPVPCPGCKGMGYKVYAKSAAQRAHTREVAMARKAKKLEAAIAAFQEENPAIWHWMHTSSFPFAVAMRDALARWGKLTDKQFAASMKCVRRG